MVIPRLGSSNLCTYALAVYNKTGTSVLTQYNWVVVGMSCCPGGSGCGACKLNVGGCSVGKLDCGNCGVIVALCSAAVWFWESERGCLLETVRLFLQILE